MKSKKIKISTLSEDIQQIIKESQGNKFDITRLCSDHSNPALLYDKKPVFGILQDELLEVFSKNSNHFFLNPEQVFRFAIFSQIPLPGIIALQIKAEFESWLAEMLRLSNNINPGLNSLLKNKGLIEKYSSEFVPDKVNIKNQFAKLKSEQKKRYEIDKIDFIIQDLISDNNFLKENKLNCNLYTQKDGSESMLLLNSSESDKQKYFQLKELWQFKTDELSETLFRLESKKRVYINVENRYLRIFGNREMKKLRQLNRVRKYAAVIKLMQVNPDLSYRELIKMVTEALIETELEKSELRSKISRSNSLLDLSFLPEGGSTITEEFRQTYISSCKKLLRKLYLLLHSDTCPSYSSLDTKKKKKINDLWLKLMKATSGEMYSYMPTMLLYQYPDLSILTDIYFKACQILGIEPDNVEPGSHLEFMISNGTPINKIIEFLKEEIDKIELHLAQLELVQNEYSHESEAEYYRNALQNANDHNEELNKEISELQNKVNNLKKEISKQLLKQKV